MDDDLSLSRVIDEIRLLRIKESFFLHEVDDLIQSIIVELWEESRRQLEAMIPYALTNAQRRRRKKRLVKRIGRTEKRLEKAVIEIAIDAKKVIEEYILLKVVQKRRGSFEKMVFFVKDHIDRVGSFGKVLEFAWQIPDTMKKAKINALFMRDSDDDKEEEESDGDGDDDKEEEEEEESKGGYFRDGDDVNDVIVGREEDINAIKTKLIIMSEEEAGWDSAGTITTASSSSSSSSYVACILGKPGVGKTAVAKKVYHDIEVRSHFDCFAWISDFGQIDEITAVFLKDILSQLTMGSGSSPRSLQQNNDHQTTTTLIVEDEDDVEILERRLYDFLKDKRYLIVLDDFGSSPEAWADFFISKKSPTSHGLKGSRVLVLTSSIFKSSEDEIGIGYLHNLQPLSEANSWEMFIKKVSSTEPLLQSPDLESIAKQFVGKCNGIALRILTIAKQLSLIENTCSAWFQLLNTQDKRNKTLETHHQDRIISSLPLPLQLCLSYLQFFPKNYEIPVRRLVALWIAEEMVMMSENDVPPEHIAMDYLQQLIEKEIVQVTQKKLVDGRPKTCRLNQIWQRNNNNHEEQSTTTTTTTTTTTSTVGIRQLPVYHTHNIEPRVMSNKKLSFDSYRFLLSFLCFDYRRSYEPSRQVKYFLRRGIDKDCFLSLKVLDLEGVYKPVLPKEVERLKNLRYLGLRWTYIDELPSFLGNLFNLQTLDVKHTYINTFPEWIHKLKRLQYLYMSENHRGKFVYRRTKAGVPHLARLQTLWGVFIDEESNLMNGLDRLANIRNLGLMYRLSTSPQQQDAMAQWLLKLDGLESLSLKSKNQHDEPSVLSLKDFNNHERLSKMYLLGDLQKEPLHQRSFPPCLRKLTLSSSKLQDDPMPILGMLPTLTILRLYSASYEGLRMHCSSSSFVQLKVLKMWKLENLEEWIVDKGSMPILEELDIRSCKGLNMLPAELQQITTIRELKVADMSDTFNEQVKLDKSWSIKDYLYFADDQMDFPKKNEGTLVANGASGSSLSSSSSSSSLGSVVLLLLLARRGVVPSSPTPTKHVTPLGLSFNSLPR